jgi:hypothetical protein
MASNEKTQLRLTLGALRLEYEGAPSPITSELCAVIEFPRIEPPLGLDQGNQQHLISATLGGPGQARDLVGGQRSLHRVTTIP